MNRMVGAFARFFFVFAWLVPAAQGAASDSSAYCPPPGDEWEVRSPEWMGIDPDGLAAANAFAVAHETTIPRHIKSYLESRARGPHDDIVGPTRPRGDMNGLILRNGFIVSEFGDTSRVDMTFSVTKSFLSTMAALAYTDGLIENLGDRVGQTIHDGNFDGRHNGQITWHNLLQQTSEWEGVLWGKPDSADRRKGKDRPLRQPGTFWEYNDVRVNLASLALLRVWQRPLPDVLKDRVMDPIGASTKWQWHGYSTSHLEIAGRDVESVSGGGHWGGGLWISSRDQARFGLLFQRRGDWCGNRLFAEDWIELATQPSIPEPRYGYMWWVNANRVLWPDVPGNSYAARGYGGNIIWIYPDAALVVVIRWLDRNHVNEYLALVTAALTDVTSEAGK